MSHLSECETNAIAACLLYRNESGRFIIAAPAPLGQQGDNSAGQKLKNDEQCRRRRRRRCLRLALSLILRASLRGEWRKIAN